MSNWCNGDSWFRDNLFTVKHNSIPKNKINDTTIQKQNYRFAIKDNACFREIPAIDCNDIEIVSASENEGNSSADFTCANLNAGNVTVAENINLKHWEPDTYCNYIASSIKLAKGTRIDKIICEIESTGTGFYSVGTIDNSIITSNNIYLFKGAKVRCSDVRFPTSITTEYGSLSGVDISFSPNTTLNGKFDVLGASVIGCTGIGDFFFEQSTIETQGHIQGRSILTSGSINNGKIIGNEIMFSGSGTSNFGLVSGNCFFASGASNGLYVSGRAIFSGNSINYGEISDEAYFYDNAKNMGTVHGLATFYNAENYGLLYNGANFFDSVNYEEGIIKSGLTYLNNSVNFGMISGQSINFALGSQNNISGIIKANNIVFNSGYNRGTIIAESGDVLFKNSSQNLGSCKSKNIKFLDESINNGFLESVSGSKFDFLNTSTNFFPINIGTNDTTLNFYNYSQNTNTGIMSVFGENSSLNFYHNSTNHGKVDSLNCYNNSINLGIIYVSASYYNDSIHISNNSGNKNLYFFDKSINQGYANNLLFKKNSTNYGSGKFGSFFDKSINYSQIKNASFFDSSINDINAIITTSGYANFYNKSTNFALGDDKILFNFYDTSINNGICREAIFNSLSKNINYVNSGSFKDNSFNDIKGIGNNLYFYDSSQNKGYVINSGVFYNNSTNEKSSLVLKARFNDYSTNKSSFTRNIDDNLPNPNILFTEYSKNHGNIIDSLVEFLGTSINLGNIRFGTDFIFTEDGIFKIKDNIENERISGADGDLLSDTDTFLRSFYSCDDQNTHPSVKFRNFSKNSGNIQGYYSYYFYDQSTNYGNLEAFTVVPKLHPLVFFIGNSKSSPCNNHANITNGRVSFINCINSGNTIYPFFENSINIGNIITSPTDGVNVGCIDLPGFSGVSFINSTNFGQSRIYANFNNSINSGNIFSSGEFIDSINFAFIAEDAVFNNSYNFGGDIGKNIYMTNSTCSGSIIRGSGIFSDHSKYIGNLIVGDAVFVSGSCKHPSGVVKGLIIQDETSTECE